MSKCGRNPKSGNEISGLRGWEARLEGDQGAQMVPRHVRIKKLPAKHKQSQVSEGRGGAERSRPPPQAPSELGRLQSAGPLSGEEAEAAAKRVGS